MTEPMEKCSRLIQCTRQIERANDLILRTIGWACAKKDFLSQEDQQEIIKNAEDIQMWVGKIMEEVKEQDQYDNSGSNSTNESGED